jgi:hypothetical protein
LAAKPGETGSKHFNRLRAKSKTQNDKKARRPGEGTTGIIVVASPI